MRRPITRIEIALRNELLAVPFIADYKTAWNCYPTTTTTKKWDLNEWINLPFLFISPLLLLLSVSLVNSYPLTTQDLKREIKGELISLRGAVYSGSLDVTIGKPPIRLGLRSLWSNAVNFMYHNKIQEKTTDITFYWPRNMERSSWSLFSLQLSFHKMAWIPSLGGPPYGCTQNPDTVCIKVLWEVLKDRDHSKHKT